jgi:hypothetical protein
MVTNVVNVLMEEEALGQQDVMMTPNFVVKKLTKKLRNKLTKKMLKKINLGQRVKINLFLIFFFNFINYFFFMFKITFDIL